MQETSCVSAPSSLQVLFFFVNKSSFILLLEILFDMIYLHSTFLAKGGNKMSITLKQVSILAGNTETEVFAAEELQKYLEKK